MKTITLPEFREHVRWWYSAPVDGSGWVTQTERRCLISLIKEFEAQVIWEIGVSEGRTAKAILSALPKEIRAYYGLDVGPGYSVPESQRNEVPAVAGSLVNDDRFNVFLDDGGWLVRPAYSNPDLVFIDGDHSREAVISHTAIAMSKFNRFSYSCLIWHDVGNRKQPGVDEAIAEIELRFPIVPTRILGTSLAFAEVKGEGFP